MLTTWRRTVAPLILNLGIRRRCVDSLTPRTLYPQKIEHRYTLCTVWHYNILFCTVIYYTRPFGYWVPFKYMKNWIYWITARFQAFSAKWMRTALFWAITQRVVVISYRRFGTTYRSHLQGSRIHNSFLMNCCYFCCFYIKFHNH